MLQTKSDSTVFLPVLTIFGCKKTSVYLDCIFQWFLCCEMNNNYSSYWFNYYILLWEHYSKLMYWIKHVFVEYVNHTISHQFSKCYSKQLLVTCFHPNKKIIKSDSSFIFGWMKWNAMKEMINGFSNSQAKWCVVIVNMREVCANVRMLVYKMQVRLRESLWS